jgi:hypothetical protein
VVEHIIPRLSISLTIGRLVTALAKEKTLSINNLEVFEVARIHQALGHLQHTIYNGNVEAGWWHNIVTGVPHPKNDITLILSKLALVHSEVSEAVEGVRKGLMDDHLKDRPMAEVEAADAMIRLLDLAGHEGWDLAGAIVDKLYYNAQRADHKIENRLAEGGKKA